MRRFSADDNPSFEADRNLQSSYVQTPAKVRIRSISIFATRVTNVQSTSSINRMPSVVLLRQSRTTRDVWFGSPQPAARQSISAQDNPFVGFSTLQTARITPPWRINNTMFFLASLMIAHLRWNFMRYSDVPRVRS